MKVKTYAIDNVRYYEIEGYKVNNCGYLIDKHKDGCYGIIGTPYQYNTLFAAIRALIKYYPYWNK